MDFEEPAKKKCVLRSGIIALALIQFLVGLLNFVENSLILDDVELGSR